MLHCLLLNCTTEKIKELIKPGEVIQEMCIVFAFQLGEEAFRSLHPSLV